MTVDEQILTLDVDPHESVLIKDPSFCFYLHLFPFTSLFLIPFSFWVGGERQSIARGWGEFFLFFFTTHHFLTLKKHLFFICLFWKELTLFQFCFLWMLTRVFGKHCFFIEIMACGFFIIWQSRNKTHVRGCGRFMLLFLYNWWCWILFDFNLCGLFFNCFWVCCFCDWISYRLCLMLNLCIWED